MRPLEFLPYVAFTAAGLFFVQAVVNPNWNERTKRMFRAITGAFFFACIGIYWLRTGEKPDETVYRLTICPFMPLEGCRPKPGLAARPPQLEHPDAATGVLLGPPMKPCAIGEVVRATADTFLLEFSVVEDSPAVQAIVSQSSEANRGDELFRAIASGEIKRFSESGQLVVGLLGVSSQGFPSRVPYLQGANICQGMAATSVDGGVLKFHVPLEGAQYQGQASIVLPRSALSAARRPHVCIEADFPLQRRGMIEGPYSQRENVRCGFPGNSSGTTLLQEYIQRGLGQMGLILIRRSK